MTTTFNKRFEKTWDKLLKRNSSEIILVGLKKATMKEAPQFIINGVFSGWTNTDNKKDIFGETNTTIKLKITDIENTYSQPGLIKGSGKIIDSFDFEKVQDKTLYLNTNINKSYIINLKISNVKYKTIINVYNEENKTYTKLILTNDKELQIPIISIGEKIYIDYNESIGDINCEATLNLVDESLKCPLMNLKSEIDFVQVQNRTFKIDSQTMNGSGNLMILTVSNKG